MGLPIVHDTGGTKYHQLQCRKAGMSEDQCVSSGGSVKWLYPGAETADQGKPS